MPERIVVLSDGTGNSSAKVWRTNVWRTFEFLDLTSPDQVAMYDDGVGTSAFLPLAVFGGAFGWGLKRNVIDLYKFICRNYNRDPQDRPSKIYAFGFSRGAFTVRVLVGLILHQGLVPYRTEQDLYARARSAYRAFRAERFHSILRIESIFRALRDCALFVWDKITRRTPYNRSENTVVPSIEFMGLWDTVAAYGLPIEEMTRGVSEWIWPLELPDRVLAPQVRRACHALSIDDQRTTFHPVLWTEAGESPIAPDANGVRWLKNERLSQVWFAGVHANVGGGYPDDALAYIPLYWLMQEAQLRGLLFKIDPPNDPDAFRTAASARDKDGRQYDSRAGIAGYYRYGPRKIKDLCHNRLSGRKRDTVEIALPKIHETVLLRLRSDSNAYAPIGIPAEYAVASSQGQFWSSAQNPCETSQEARARADDQETVWNIVWLRRITYFATLAASLHLALFWRFHDVHPEREFNTALALVPQTVRFFEVFLPRQAVRWWTDYFATNPISFLVGLIVLVGLIWFGSKLEDQVTDRMRTIWTSRAVAPTIWQSVLQNSIYALRTSWPYQAAWRALRYYLLPFFSAMALLWLGLAGFSHLVWNIVDPMGVVCSPTDEKQKPLKTIDHEHRQAVSDAIFATNSPCFATGLKLTKGARYAVTITSTEPWQDGSYPTDPSGYQIDDRDGFAWLRSFALMPLRRDYFRRWFTVVARVGAVGMYEDFLDPRKLDPSKADSPYYGETGRIKADGELFLYVNEATIALPWVHGVFYNCHYGAAKIEIQRLGG
jgi:uncharacterized protein (DUF2235 family)